MEVRLMQKGERGLFIANDHKLLFPDRSWKDVQEGFVYDIEVTLDKGTYAFVRGKMLQTEPIDISCLNIDMENTTYYRSGQIGEQQFMMDWNSNIRHSTGYRVYVRTSWPGGVSLERVKLPTRAMQVIDYLHTCSNPIDMATAIADSVQELNFESDEQYANEMFKLLRKVYERDRVIGKVKTQLRVYKSSLVIGKIVYSHGSVTYSVYKYAGELGKGNFKLLSAFPQHDAEVMYEQADPIGMEELLDFVKDYKVCVGWNKYSGTAFDERLTSRIFQAYGSGVVVYAFNLNGYDLSWLQTDEAQPYVQLVEESFERLDYLKKRLAKMRIPLDELSGLNVMEWLAPFECKE